MINNVLEAVCICFMMIGFASLINNAVLPAIYKRYNISGENILKITYIMLSFVSPPTEEIFKFIAFSKSIAVLWIYLVLINIYEFCIYYNTLKKIGKGKAILLRLTTVVMHMMTGVLHMYDHHMLALLLHVTWNTVDIYGVMFINKYRRKKRMEKTEKILGETLKKSLNL